jgi:uncharacterized protein YehS (DUF1456 family)
MPTRDQERALFELYDLVRQLGSLVEHQSSSDVLLEIAMSARTAIRADLVTLFERKEDQSGFAPPIIVGEVFDSEITLKRFEESDIPIGKTDFFERENIKAFIAIPLKFGDEVVGVLSASYHTSQTFTNEQKALVELFASQAALAIKSMQILRRLRELLETERHSRSVSERYRYYSCFISHSSRDEDFARKLYADLQNAGVRCWFAPVDLKIGDRMRSRIDEVVRDYDKLLLVISKHSTKSQWVEHEVEAALERERREGSVVLFPVRLDDEISRIETGWATFVRNTRHIGDFSNWHELDSYSASFDLLLRDLRD